MKMPSFEYVAKWELARIQTSSEQIGLEEKFVSLLAEGREALQKGQLAEAFSLVKQAMTLDESLRSDPRARTLLHEIRAKGTKVRLRGASLVQMRSSLLPMARSCSSLKNIMSGMATMS